MRLFITTILVFSFFSINAQDRQFARTYQSNTLQKGSVDLEVWSTYRTGREYFYKRIDSRIEFEVGLTDKLQTSIYLNTSHSAFGASLDTMGGIADTTIDGISTESEFSISSEWKLNLLNVNTSPIGLALYTEFTFAPNEFEIENKIILDTRNEKNTFALNLSNEYAIKFEVAKGKKTRSWEAEPEIDLAYMHFLKPNLGIGLEMVNINEIENNKWNFSALYAGPTLFYTASNYYIILNILPQLANLHKTDDAPNNLVLNAREKLEVRLLLGFNL